MWTGSAGPPIENCIGWGLMVSNGAYSLNIFGVTCIKNSETPKNPTETQARILERLALDHPAPVPLAELVTAVWVSSPPKHSRAALQNQISRIRSSWGSHTILTGKGGYTLGIPNNLHTLRELVTSAETLLEAGRAEEAFEAADSALGLHTGKALPSLDHITQVDAVRRETATLVEMAANLRLAAGIRLQRMVWSLAEAERLTRLSPHDEYRASLLARAHVLAGRRGDALASILSARHRLREELGIDPGPHLTKIEEEIRQPHSDAPKNGPFIARQEELRITLARLSAERLIRISAEPGGGISRFLLALYSHLRQLGVNPVLVDAASHQGSADAALMQLLIEAKLSPDEHGIMGGFVDVVAKSAMERPISLIVDNADTLGPTSVKILTKAATLPGVSVVLGAHSMKSDDSVIFLPPLNKSDVAGILRAAGDDPARAPELTRYSGGNPLAISLLLRHPTLAPGDLAPAPALLHQLSDLLLSGLAPEERRVVERAAVYGENILLDEPVPESIFISDKNGNARFRHGVLRSLVYYDLPPSRREDLHLAAADRAREVGAPNAIIAEHLLAAGALAGEEVGDACRAAAADAHRLGAHAEAAEWWNRAASTSSGARHLLDRVATGNAQRLAGEPAHVETLTNVIAEAMKLGDGEVLSEATYALLQLGSTSGDAELLARIEPLVDTVLEVVTEPSGRAKVLGAASLAWSLVGEAEQSRSFFLQAITLAESEPLRMELLPLSFMSLGHPCDLNLREAHAEELVRLAAKHNDPVSRFEGAQLGASVAFFRGKGLALRHHRRVMEETIQEVGDVGRRWGLLFSLAAIAHVEGRWQECAELTEAAKELFTPVSPIRAMAASAGQVFGLHLSLGKVHELLPTLSHLVQSQPGIPAWHAAYALALAEVKGSAAIEHVHRAMEQAEPDVTWLASQTTSARAAALIGETDTISELIETLTPWSGLGIWQGTCCYGPVDTPLGLLHSALGDDQTAQSHFRRAAQWAARLDAPAFEQEALTLAGS